jgi:hypothetical protein
VVGGTNLLLSPLRKQQLEPLMEKGQKSISSAKENRVKTTQKFLEITALLDVMPSGLAGTNMYKSLLSRFFRLENMVYWADCCSVLGTRLSKF